ncbi:MAG TPA: methyltransferase domain-containing protein [Vicinamibacteria bacterium]|nr:methyltransferase domain-containing protein [Vicinamibacteria bacterium]
MKRRLAFYRETVSRWITDREASILVAAGGKADRDVLMELGFRNVVISNLNDQPGEDLDPYEWRREDLESLSAPDESFDYVIVHAGLHHCRSPHRGVLEMFRVARRAIVAFDPPDNITVRTMQRLGLAQVYECAAVEGHGGLAGGIYHSHVPNFIYRWTESEVEKTIRSYAPEVRHRFRYAYDVAPPTENFTDKTWAKRVAVKVLAPSFWLYGQVFRRQRNLFGFMVEKGRTPGDLHPWLEWDEGRLRFRLPAA